MARKKAAHERAQKKAAKQKKILIVLVVALLVALVVGFMTLSGGSKSPQPVSATPASSSTPAGSVPAAGATPSDLVAAVTPGISAVPVDSFRSFALLGQKNPFHDHGPNANAAAGSGKAKNAKPKKQGGGSKSKGSTAPLTGAVISLNGEKLALALGAKFGSAPGLRGVPLFKLVHVTAKSALVDVVGTKQQFTLHVKQPLTLQQYGGWTYTLILEPLGSAAPMTVQTTTSPGN